MDERSPLSSADGIVLSSLRGDGLIADALGAVPEGDLSISDDGTVLTLASVVPDDSGVWRIVGDTLEPVELHSFDVRFLGVTITDGRVFAINETSVAIVDVLTDTTVVFPDWDVRELNGFGGPITPDWSRIVLLGPDGRFEVRSGYDGTLLYEVTDLQTDDGSSTNISYGFGHEPGTYLTVNEGVVDIRKLETGRVIRSHDVGPGLMVQHALTPDGRALLTAARNGTITVRDVDDFQPTGQEFVGNTTSSNGDVGPVFTPDGTHMVTTSDSLGRMWDMATGAQIGSTFPDDVGWSTGVSWNARWLVSVVDGRVVRWDLDAESWPAIVCTAAGRNLTKAEWEQFGPNDTGYRATCDEYAIDNSPADAATA